MANKTGVHMHYEFRTPKIRRSLMNALYEPTKLVENAETKPRKSRFDPVVVAAIRWERETLGASTRELGLKFGISTDVIYNICEYQFLAHIDPAPMPEKALQASGVK